MNIGIVAPPFIPVPPAKYGGTELFAANLARELHARGHRVIVYANGESRLPCEVRWKYPRGAWPPVDPASSRLMQLNHLGWAVADAVRERLDIVQVNDAEAVHFARLLPMPMVMTLHHPHEEPLSELYLDHPDVRYVAISAAQASRERMPRIEVIHHGIDFDDYPLSTRPRSYFCFIARMVPCKGVHLAIDVARRANVPLKIAGEIQPFFKDYWHDAVEPHLDGRLIEYVGEADLALKNELLAGARALLFPIDWEEPFGLAMIEAMACGTPVLALARGSVPEVVDHEVTGWICRDVDEMVALAAAPPLDPRRCRDRAAARFSIERMGNDYERLFSAVIGEEPPTGERDPTAPDPVATRTAPERAGEGKELEVVRKLSA